ncbi:reverse transcriptase domain-containing protein [Tanacetum coccineum]
MKLPSPFTINNYNSYAIANIDASYNVIHRSVCEYLKLANLRGATMSVEMDDMTQQETLRTLKNVLIKSNKFEFPCDFVVTKMPENLGEIIILGRTFLETIHAQLNVFQEEISLGIGQDRIKFDINGNPRQSNITIKKNYMENTGQEEESFNPLEIGYEEEELWRSGDEKTDYEPPFVDIKTFEVKRYSFKMGHSFICKTKQDDDALPLGRVNGARFKAMIKKELKDKGIAHDET